MVKKLSILDPYKTLCKDLYSADIFDQAIDGLLFLVEKDDGEQTLLIEKKFVNNSEGYLNSGYYFIQCINSVCSDEQIKKFRGLLEKVVKQKAKGNYMEVEPIIVAQKYDDSVIEFVEQYNKMQKRKPIQLFIYEE